MNSLKALENKVTSNEKQTHYRNLMVILLFLNAVFSKLYFCFQLFNDLFKNNANRSENTERRQNQNYFMEMLTVEGVYDYLMYIGKK